MKFPKWLLPALLILAIAAALTAKLMAPEPAQPVPTSVPAQPTQTAEPVPTQVPATEVPQAPALGGWWNDTVFYEIFVRSFKDSDGDGVGDINGLIENLDYLNDGDPATTTDLGITGIWLMPITESPSYHGYDVVDYYAVDQEYGTKEDFQRLMEEAHRRGIRIIVDLVLNHTGVGHPWFQQSDAGDPEYRDWYIWEEKAPTYLGPWGQPVWHRGQDGFFYGVFWSGMPDLNLENPAVNAEISEITRFWLEEMGVDGFRMDAIKHFVENGIAQENTPATHTWLQAFHIYYKSLNPEAFVVGETWTDTANVLKYTGNEVDIGFQFDVAEAFVRAAGGPLASSATENLQLTLESMPENQYGVFLTNHDQDRVMSVLNDFQKAKLAAVMLLTSPGVPFIYYGEEIGMTGSKPDEDIRLPMQWTGEAGTVGFTTGTPWRAPAGDYPTTNVLLQSEDPDSLLNLYRFLIHLRSAHPALMNGSSLLVETDSARLYALLRYDQDEAFLILVNAHTKPLVPDLYQLSLEAGPFQGVLQAESILGPADPLAPEINAAGGFSGYVPFAEIPAQSAAIIRLTPALP